MAKTWSVYFFYILYIRKRLLTYTRTCERRSNLSDILKFGYEKTTAKKN